MSLDYSIYSESTVDDLGAIVSDFTGQKEVHNLLFFGKVIAPHPLDLEILKEHGFQGKYASVMTCSINNKEEVVAAQEKVHDFISNYLDVSKVAVLLNGEPVKFDL